MEAKKKLWNIIGQQPLIATAFQEIYRFSSFKKLCSLPPKFPDD